MLGRGVGKFWEEFFGGDGLVNPIVGVYVSIIYLRISYQRWDDHPQ